MEWHNISARSGSLKAVSMLASFKLKLKAHIQSLKVPFPDTTSLFISTRSDLHSAKLFALNANVCKHFWRMLKNISRHFFLPFFPECNMQNMLSSHENCSRIQLACYKGNDAEWFVYVCTLPVLGRLLFCDDAALTLNSWRGFKLSFLFDGGFQAI